MSEDSTIPLDPLLEEQGVQFLQHAYESLFRRTLDPGGQRTYCAAMRAGFSKIHILYSMVNSSEGRSLRLSLSGLTLRYWKERMLPPPFIRRALGLHVPDSSWALMFADLDALNCRVQSLESAIRAIDGDTAALPRDGGSVARLGEGTARVVAQILHNSGESARMAYELERAVSQVLHQLRVETVTPRHALDLAHMLRASIARLERTPEQLTSTFEVANAPGGQYTTPIGLTVDESSQRMDDSRNELQKRRTTP